MAGTGTPNVGASHPRSPVWPPRRAASPGPAAASDDGLGAWPGGRGRFGAGAAREPAERSRRVERLLWLLVAAVTLAGIVLIGAIVRSGPEPGAGLPLVEATGVESSGAGDDDPEAGVAGERAPPGPDDVGVDVGAPDEHAGSAAGGLSSDGRPGTGPSTDAPEADGAEADGDGPDGSAADDEPAGACPPGELAGGDGPPGDDAGDPRPGNSATGDGADAQKSSCEDPSDDELLSDEAGTPAGTGGGAPAGWSEVARGFGLAFTRTSVGREAWFAAMSSWLTPEQAAEYRDVPIEDIPNGELIEVDVAEPDGASHTLGTLTYDTGMVLEVGLSHVESAGGWLVARVSLAGTHPGRSTTVRGERSGGRHGVPR